MLVTVLCSGSEGNSTLIRTKKHNVLIDLGMNNKYITSKLEQLGVLPNDIDVVCITHTHSDHTGAMKVFFKKNTPIVLADTKMLVELPFLEDYNNFNFDTKFTDDELSIEAFKTSHDAPGSRGYIIKEDNKSMVYLTDSGYVNHKLFDKLSNHNIYIFESNHDIEMLMHGRYPAWLKQRVRSDEGHLSNQQSGFYLSKLIGPNTKQVVLAHLSKENNTPEMALNEVRKCLKESYIDFDNFKIALQNDITECEEI